MIKEQKFPNRAIKEDASQFGPNFHDEHPIKSMGLKTRISLKKKIEYQKKRIE